MLNQKVNVHTLILFVQEESDSEDEEDDAGDELKSPSKEGIQPIEAELKLEDAPADIDVLLDVAEPENNLATGGQNIYIF